MRMRVHIWTDMPTRFSFLFYISTEGIVECCPGYSWNKIENRCIGQFYVIYSLYIFSSLSSIRCFKQMHEKSCIFPILNINLKIQDAVLVHLDHVVICHVRIHNTDATACQNVPARRITVILLTVVPVSHMHNTYNKYVNDVLKFLIILPRIIKQYLNQQALNEILLYYF